MILPADIRESVLSYARHEAAKSLSDLAALMERTGADCARCLEGVSEEQATFKYEQEWPMKDVVGHIVDSTRSVNRGIAELAAGRRPTDVGRIGETPGHDRAIAELRRELRELWEETTRLVASLPEDGPIDTTRAHPWFGDLNFREWIAFQRLHAMDHIRQMEKVKAHPDYPAA